MNVRKFGISDDSFLPKMIERCRDDEERGLVYVLYFTGMHGGSLRSLTRENLKREGDRYFISWRRKKTNKLLEAEIPSDKLGVITSFLEARRKKSIRWVNTRLHQMGKDSGYDGVCAMTFRHTRCIKLILQGAPLPAIKEAMGCTEQVIERAYGKMTPEQLREATRLRQ